MPKAKSPQSGKSVPADIAHLRVISKREMSDLLGAAVNSIDNYVSAGLIPKPFKFGKRRVGWLAGDVQAWIQSRKAAA